MGSLRRRVGAGLRAGTVQTPFVHGLDEFRAGHEALLERGDGRAAVDLLQVAAECLRVAGAHEAQRPHGGGVRVELIAAVEAFPGFHETCAGAVTGERAVRELDELADIYVKRGVDHPLARQVAQQLMAKDALTAHARDELGISEVTAARPVQAALTSAAMFSIGAAMPLLMVVVSPTKALLPIVAGASLGFLALLGAIGARAGGANILRATVRVTFWGALALAITAGIGKLFGTVV